MFSVLLRMRRRTISCALYVYFDNLCKVVFQSNTPPYRKEAHDAEQPHLLCETRLAIWGILHPYARKGLGGPNTLKFVTI